MTTPVPAPALTRDRRRPPTIDTLLPWTTTNVSIRPFGMGWWSFNPSIHHDPTTDTWRCAYRCANYSLPDGVVQLSDEAHHGKARSRNVVAVLDPAGWGVRSLSEVGEFDDLPRVQGCTSLGLEDMRLFRTSRDGICGIATALQYNASHPNRPEMVLCRFRDPDDLGAPASSGSRRDPGRSDAYDVVQAIPIRGPWDCRPQKNWSPFDDATVPRFLYSIERGVVMGEDGHVAGSPSPMGTRATADGKITHVGKNGVEVRILTNPNAPTSQVATSTAANVGSSELRGGSQLLAIEDGTWLGLAHEMTTAQPNRRKLYWHTFYTVDDAGQMTGRSARFKLSTHDIEFAAGMAICRGRVVISYGTDDHDARIGETSLDRVLAMLRPAEPDGRDAGASTGTGAIADMSTDAGRKTR